MLLLFGYLVICIGLVFGAPETSTIDGYVITIDNHILKSVVATSNPSDNLNLSSLQLNDIAWNAFRDLNNLKTLNLSNNNLELFNEMALVPLRNLVNLSLANNKLGPMANQFVALDNLKFIDVTNSTDVFFPSNKFRIRPKLVHIEGYHMLSPQLETELNFNLTSRFNFLTVLCIMENGIVRSLEHVPSAEYLRQDTIQNCNKAQLFEGHFREIAAENLDITGFEPNWYSLRSDFLETLSLANNMITDLRSIMINNLPPVLSLKNNPIKRVERGIINNKALTHFDLRNCSISEIEDNAFVDTSLKKLLLSNNKLTNLNFLATLPTGLTNLDLASNKLVQLVPGAFRRFTNLTILNLNVNNLTSLAGGVFDGLENLYELFLDHNQITDITAESLRGLSRTLHLLNIGWNNISKLKSGTFINKPRGSLNLQRNKIKEIESGTFNLPELTYLDLSSNLLTTLRNETFLGLPKLLMLYLPLNNITTIEAGVFSHLNENVTVCRDNIPLEPYCKMQLRFA